MRDLVNHRTVLAKMLVLCVGMLAWSDSSRAEWYLAAQGGLQAPQDLANIHGTGSFDGVTSNNLNLRNQLAFGIKAGYFFSDAWNWIGLEFDFSHSDANIERQGITADPGRDAAERDDPARRADFK
jgi:hypothetical protein